MTSDYQLFYKNNIDAIDTKWHQFTEVQFQWILSRLKYQYGPKDQFSIMDLGCGTGRLLEMIHAQFPYARLSGIDGTTLMVFRTQNRLPLGADIKKHDLDTYEITDSYDVIISTTVMHHLKHPASHINMIARHLNDGGVAYVSEFAVDTWPLRLANLWWSLTYPSHKKAWSYEKFTGLINQSDLKITESDIVKPDWFWRLQLHKLTK